jgi:4-amino-4-deoxychorismate lyase
MPTEILDCKKNLTFSLDDRIFLGEGLLETLSFSHARPCYAKFHWQRMQKSAGILKIPFDISSNDFYNYLIDCIQVSKLSFGGIKVILSGGRAPRGLNNHSLISYLAVDVFSYPLKRNAINLVSSEWLRDGRNPVYQIKSINYLEAILAKSYAPSSSADEVLFFNSNNFATDTTVANIFIVKDDKIYTPMLTDGVLPGIIRGRVLVLCKKFIISCEETNIDKKLIMTADAIFTTNSLQGIREVRSFDGKIFLIKHHIITLLQKLLAEDAINYQ